MKKVSKKSIQYLNSLIATRTAKSRYVDDMKRVVELYKDRKITTEREAALTITLLLSCLLYTSPSPRDRTRSRMPSSA